MSSISGITDLGQSIDSQAALDGLSDEQLAALSAACEAEQARRVEASRRAGADGPSAEERRQLEVMTRQVSSGAASSALGERADGAIGLEGKAAVAAEQGCTVHELSTIAARLEFARAHGLAFDEGVQDTLEEDLDASGIPERYTPVRVGVGLILTPARTNRARARARARARTQVRACAAARLHAVPAAEAWDELLPERPRRRVRCERGQVRQLRVPMRCTLHHQVHHEGCSEGCRVAYVVYDSRASFFQVPSSLLIV